MGFKLIFMDISARPICLRPVVKLPYLTVHNILKVDK